MWQRKKTGREDPKAVTTAQQVEQPAVGTLDSNYNVEVSNIFSPLSNFQCKPKESISESLTSPISPALSSLPPPTYGGTLSHAVPAPSFLRTPWEQHPLY